MGMVDITGLDKAEVLLALYENSDCIGMGILQAVENYTLEDARRDYEESRNKYFDYLHGRAVKVDLSRNSFDSFFYDRYFGEGAAQRIIDGLRERGQYGIRRME